MHCMICTIKVKIANNKVLVFLLQKLVRNLPQGEEVSSIRSKEVVLTLLDFDTKYYQTNSELKIMNLKFQNQKIVAGRFISVKPYY